MGLNIDWRWGAKYCAQRMIPFERGWSRFPAPSRCRDDYERKMGNGRVGKNSSNDKILKWDGRVFDPAPPLLEI